MNGLAGTYRNFPNTYSNNFNNYWNQNLSDWTSSLSQADLAKLSNNAQGLASSANNIQWGVRGPEFSQGLSPSVTNSSVADTSWWGQNGGLIKDVGGAVMSTVGAITAFNDMLRNNRTFKEQKKNYEMQREIARENLAMQRAEYNRLKSNRANLSKAYGA
jgi:hypothetical protein